MTHLLLDNTWAVHQLTKLHKQRPELVDTAMDEFLSMHPDLKWSLVLSAYLDEEINLGKAAELLEVHELELRQQFIELGIPLRLGPPDEAAARAEVNAIKSWFNSNTNVDES